MKSLYDKEAYAEIHNRLEALNHSDTAKWGTMTVSEMLAHCHKPLKVVLGELRDTGFKNPLVKLLFKKQMYNDRLWKHGMPTPKTFKVESDRGFLPERESLKAKIDQAYGARTVRKPKHPLFGKFTDAQWGQMQYKHLDHHLRQFGV